MTSPMSSAAASLQMAVDPGAAPPTPTAPSPGVTGRSPRRIAWLRFRRDRTGVVSAWVVLFFFMVGIAAPLIAKLYGKDPYTTYGQNQSGLLNDFGGEHRGRRGVRAHRSTDPAGVVRNLKVRLWRGR
ncbi:hypothetical protein [Streptomyces sp. NPDC014995]|uniref:hypothetical protein n=1 Tax=Streptomyces sp. NPDC014995 TaxID=3364936 RepID=UPI0036FE98EF